MRTLERYDFREEYGISPNRFLHMDEGESVAVELKDCPTRVLKVEKINGTKTCRSSMVLSENGEKFLLDLSPHWERDTADIELCHEGVVNLIKAIYMQTESDYESYYLAGEKGFVLEQNIGESRAEYEKRRSEMFRESKAKCEEFLGEVFTRYAKVRALWRVTHNINYIAARLNETPEHISCIVERLGLNRP